MALKQTVAQKQSVNTLQSLLSMSIGGLILCYVFVMKGMSAEYVNSTLVEIGTNQVKFMRGQLINKVGASFVNNGQIHFQGNVINHGSMSCGECGSGANYFNDKDDIQQHINGTQAIQLYDVILDNAKGLSIDTEVRIANSFLFLEGMVRTNVSDPSHFLHFEEGAVVSGASASRYVEGYVGRTGMGPFTYPTGGNGGFFPVTLKGNSSHDFFQVRFLASDPELSGYSISDIDPEMLSEVWNKGFWQIQGNSNVSIQLHWDASAKLENFVSGLDSLVVVGWDGIEWIDLGNAGTKGRLEGGAISSDPIVPNAFHAFGLGRANMNHLSVEWIEFETEPIEADVQLSWTASTESDSSMFEVERSFDGVDFLPIKRLASGGMRTEQISYQYTDPKISYRFASTVYYRIRLEDPNGDVEYSEVQQVRLGKPKSGIDMTVFPNPANEQLYVQYELKGAFQLGQIELYGQAGTTLFQKDVTERGETKISLHSFPVGTYHVVLTNEDSRTSKKLIKR